MNDAYDRGHERGANAGEWYFDGDPEILNTFPSFTFGEWAGESIREILGDEYTDEDVDEYLDGWYSGVHDEIETTALAMMGD